MRQWTIRALCAAGIMFLWLSCRNEQALFDNFYKAEKASLTNTAHEILAKLGLENAEVIVYTHRSVNNRVLSKSMSDTNWLGPDFTPEGPAGMEDTVFKDPRELYGYMRQRTLTANYEQDKKREISYDNFAIIIIIDTITPRQKDALLRLFDSCIVNTERGDTVFVISKEEFNRMD